MSPRKGSGPDRDAIKNIIREVLAETVETPAAISATTGQPVTAHVHDDVSCRLCGTIVSRDIAKAEAWTRDAAAGRWVCRAHTPIDYPDAARIAGLASDELRAAVEKLCSFDIGALDNIDEAENLLADLRVAVAALRSRSNHGAA